MNDPTEIWPVFRTIREMKYFAVLYEYNANHPRLADVRPAHREFIEVLHSQEQILGSGPFTDSKRGRSSSSNLLKVPRSKMPSPSWTVTLSGPRKLCTSARFASGALLPRRLKSKTTRYLPKTRASPT